MVDYFKFQNLFKYAKAICLKFCSMKVEANVVHNMMAFFFYHVLNIKLFFSTCSKPFLSKYNTYTMFNILWDAKSHLAIVFNYDKSHIISWLSLMNCLLCTGISQDLRVALKALCAVSRFPYLYHCVRLKLLLSATRVS